MFDGNVWGYVGVGAAGTLIGFIGADVLNRQRYKKYTQKVESQLDELRGNIEGGSNSESSSNK